MMGMTKLYHRKDHHLRALFLYIAFLTALMLLFTFGTGLLSHSSRNHEREVLETAIERDITACYALEGHYPESLDYIREHYGLTYNEKRFFVDYTVRGSNLRPTYVILERGDGDEEKES